MTATLIAGRSFARPEQMMKDLPLRLKPGTIVEIDGVEYVFERVDPDGCIVMVTLRNRVKYQIVNSETGNWREPISDDIAALMAAGRFIVRAQQLDDAARSAARKRGIDSAAARAIDPVSDFRITYCRAYDKQPCSLSDVALQLFARDLLRDEKVAALPGARIYAGSTFREWIKDRGHVGDRRTRDGISMRGHFSTKKVKHPVEILLYYVACATGLRTTSSPHARVKPAKAYNDYKGEIIRINAGRATGREGAEYDKPEEPYKFISASTFRRYCIAALSSETLASQSGSQAVYQRYGGGGRTEPVHQVGQLGLIDDTPVPALFVIDDERKIPLGQPTLTLLKDACCKGIWGADLSWDHASSATVLRTILSANTPKIVPDYIREQHPYLAWMCGKHSCYLVDNLSAHHSRHVTDSVLDAGIDIDYSGAGMPRDKAPIERGIGVILSEAVKHLPAATYDVAKAREFGFNPDTMIMINLTQMREILWQSIYLYNLTPQKGLGNHSPAYIFMKHLNDRGISIIEDIDEFQRAIGDIEYDVTLTSAGVVVQGLRYSDARVTRSLVEDYSRSKAYKKTKRLSFKVKVKYSPDNLGVVHVWNEVTKRYVTLPSVNPEYSDGLPLWAHSRLLSLNMADEREFMGETELTVGHNLIELRKRFFENIRDINPEAAERDQRTVARLMDSTLFKSLQGEIVVTSGEAPANLTELFSHLPDGFMPDEMAAPHRTDATEQPHVPTAKSTSPNRKRKSKLSHTATTSPPSAAEAPTSTAKSTPTAKPKWGAEYD